MVRPVLVLMIAMATSAGAVRAQDLAYSFSLQLSSGSYIFTEPTRTLSLYNGLSLDVGRLRFGVGVPVIIQDGRFVTVVGGTVLPTGGEGHEEVAGRKRGEPVSPGGGKQGGSGDSGTGPGGPGLSLIGLEATDAGTWAVLDSTGSADGVEASSVVAVGDPLVSTAMSLFEGRGAVRSVELTASAKAPLNGLESGVGTGEWDYGAGASAAVAMGPVVGFLDATYWWYGDLAGLELRDGASWALGLGAPMARSVWVSAMATRGNRVIESAEAAATVSVGISYQATRSGLLSLLAGAGLTETAADFSVSVGWRQVLMRGR